MKKNSYYFTFDAHNILDITLKDIQNRPEHTPKLRFNNLSFMPLIEHFDSLTIDQTQIIRMIIIQNDGIDALLTFIKYFDTSNHNSLYYHSELQWLSFLLLNPTTQLLCAIYLPDKLPLLLAYVAQNYQPSWQNKLCETTTMIQLANLSPEQQFLPLKTLFDYYNCYQPNNYLSALNQVPPIHFTYYFQEVIFLTKYHPKFNRLLLNIDDFFIQKLFDVLIEYQNFQYLSNKWFEPKKLFLNPELASLAFKSGTTELFPYCDFEALLVKHPEKFT